MKEQTWPKEEEPEDWILLSVREEAEGKRLDRFLVEQLPGVGRKLASRLCEQGDVWLSGRRAKKSTLLPPRGEVVVRPGPWGRALPAPEVSFGTILETPDLVVAEKPPGLPSAALVNQESGTMAGALLARYPEMAGVGFSPREPGIIHRLDNDTSGLLLAARNQSTFVALRDALSSGQIQKKYLALVPPGTLPEDEGVIELALRTDERNRRRVTAVPAQGGYPATTKFRVLERGRACDLVEAAANSAFRHQVRVHLASRGAPLLGDVLYGGDPALLPTRHALHASYIAGAAKGVPDFSAESPLPEELRALLSE